MKRIMFNDRYGLTRAVIEGRKTMTRRRMNVTQPRSLANCLQGLKYECMVDEDDNNYEARYYVGEIVAVAQKYRSFVKPSDWDATDMLAHTKGWNNKMFVCADLMPHQVRITAVRAARLQDISDEECIKEGVRFFPVLNSYYFEDFDKEEGFYFDTTREAFAALIDKVSGRGTWERNPWVWVYEFERVK